MRVPLTRPAILLLALLMSACGGEEEQAPQLAALPTRTPVPATEIQPTGTPAALPDVEIVSLRAQMDAFITASENASVLDRIDLIGQNVTGPAQPCFASTLWPQAQPIELLTQGLSLPSADMAAWRESVDTFPEAELIQAVNDALRQVTALLPLDGPLRVCLVPMMPFGPPEEMPNGGVRSQVLGGNLLLLTCSAGPACVDHIGQETIYAYAEATQFARAGLSGLEIPLLSWAIFSGRAEDAVHQIDPAAVFAWSDALTPAQEQDVWTRMQDYLQTTYSDYPGYRNVDRFLYGGDNQERYPRFAGLYIGGKIVRAYRAGHPNISEADLMALAPDALLADSGYTPG